MTQKSDRFYIYLKWDNLTDPEENKALNKKIKEKLKEITSQIKGCGFHHYHSDRLRGGELSKIDIHFDLKSYNWANSGIQDFNAFVNAVRAFDEFAGWLPEECDVLAQYSTTDYKAPWVQRNESRSLGLVVRKGVSELVLDDKVLGRLNLKTGNEKDAYKLEQVKIIGEPTEAAKVYATLRVLSRNRKISMVEVLGKLTYLHRNTRWLLLMKTDQNRTYTYGHSVVSRTNVSLDTIYGYERPLENLLPKYTSTTKFGSDMYVMPV